MHHFPGSFVDSLGHVKGGGDIGLQLQLPISHGADQRNAARLQMVADKGVEAVAVLVRHQHMDNGHGIEKVKPLLQPLRHTVEALKPRRIRRVLFPAIADCLRRDVCRQQIVPAPQQRRGIAPLPAADLQQRIPGRNGKPLHGLRHNGRGLVAGPLQILPVDLPIPVVICLIVFLPHLHTS